MRQTEQTARTVEEAVEQGLHLLGVRRDQVDVEILEEPGSGLFGLGGKQARVRVMVCEVNTEKAREVLEELVRLLKLNAMVEMTQSDDTVRFEVLGDDLGVLIGHRGQTLNALQFLLGVILTRGVEKARVRCILDVEGYRIRREKSLQILAEKMAKKASMERRPVTLEPMLPSERRIIHLALEKNPYVTSSSEGDEPMRRVIIKPKAGARGGGRGRSRSARDPNRRFPQSRGSRWGYSRQPRTSEPPPFSDEPPPEI